MEEAHALKRSWGVCILVPPYVGMCWSVPFPEEVKNLWWDGRFVSDLCQGLRHPNPVPLCCCHSFVGWDM